MIDTTPSAVNQKFAHEEILTARELYNSGSIKKKLQANLHFKNAMGCAQNALKDNNDVSVACAMKKIIEESKQHLPADIDTFIEAGWNNYEVRSRKIYFEVFGEHVTDKSASLADYFRNELAHLQNYYEKFETEYGFLTQDKFIEFFSNPNAIYNNGNLWNCCYGTRVCYTDIVLEFELVFREFLRYGFYKNVVEGSEKLQYGTIWAEMRQKYCNGKGYVHIDEMIADGRLEQFTAKEVLAALYFCLIYKERFCEGYFLDCCENGEIGKLILHLKKIN